MILIVLMKEKLQCCSNCSFELCLVRQEIKSTALKSETLNDPNEFYAARLIRKFHKFYCKMKKTETIIVNWQKHKLFKISPDLLVKLKYDILIPLYFSVFKPFVYDTGLRGRKQTFGTRYKIYLY